MCSLLQVHYGGFHSQGRIFLHHFRGLTHGCEISCYKLRVTRQIDASPALVCRSHHVGNSSLKAKLFMDFVAFPVS